MMDGVQGRRVARVVEVRRTESGRQRAVLLLGPTLHAVEVDAPTLAPGDLFATEGEPPVPVEKIGAADPGAWSAAGDALRWRRPDARGRTRFDALWLRHRIRRAVRDDLDREGFIEIDAPLLVEGTTPDLHVRSFAVGGRYLAPSTEYQIKRLEAGGFDRIYTLTQNFREGDVEGRFRHPEFTMLEWARVGRGLVDIERDAERLTLAAHAALGGDGAVRFGDHAVSLAPPWDRLTVVEALARHAGSAPADFSAGALWEAATAAGLAPPEAWRDDAPVLFSSLMSHVQPRLGTTKPVFLRGWPAFETSSTSAGPGGVAERSELIIAGVEIADGFPTLTDAERQRRAFGEQNRLRAEAGLRPSTLDERYLGALAAGMPRGAGMALGFDRLVMVLTDRAAIGDVLAFGPGEV